MIEIPDKALPEKLRERCAFFIDGTNLFRGLKECYDIERIKIDEYCRYLAKGRDITGIYYAEAPLLPKLGYHQFHIQREYLKYIKSTRGVIFRKGKYSTWTTPPTEKKSDVNIAVDLVDLCHRDMFDVAFLISGDTDLCPAVDVVIREGKKVFVSYFEGKRNAYGLRNHANGNFIHLTNKLAKEYLWDFNRVNTCEKCKKEPESGKPNSGGTV